MAAKRALEWARLGYLVRRLTSWTRESARTHALTELSWSRSSTSGVNVGRSTRAAAPTAHFASSQGSTSTATPLSGGTGASEGSTRTPRPDARQACVPSPLTSTSCGLRTLTRSATERPRIAAASRVDLPRRRVAGVGELAQAVDSRAARAAPCAAAPRRRAPGRRRSVSRQPRLPQRQGGPSSTRGDVTELAGAAAEAAIDVAADDDPEADTAADRDRQEVVDVPASPVQPLGDGERVDVVVGEHRHAEALPAGGERAASSLQPSIGELTQPAVGVDHARHAERRARAARELESDAPIQARAARRSARPRRPPSRRAAPRTARAPRRRGRRARRRDDRGRS